MGCRMGWATTYYSKPSWLSKAHVPGQGEKDKNKMVFPNDTRAGPSYTKPISQIWRPKSGLKPTLSALGNDISPVDLTMLQVETDPMTTEEECASRSEK